MKDFFSKREAYVARAITLRTLVGIKNVSVIFDNFCYDFLQSQTVREEQSAALIIMEFLKDTDSDGDHYCIVCSRYDTNKQFFDSREGINIINKYVVESISLGLSLVCHKSKANMTKAETRGEFSAYAFLNFSQQFSVIKTEETNEHKGMSFGCAITHFMNGYLVVFNIALYAGDKSFSTSKKKKTRNEIIDMKKLAELGKIYAETYS